MSYVPEIIEHRLMVMLENDLKEKYDSDFTSVRIISVDCTDPTIWHVTFEFIPAPFTVEVNIVPPVWKWWHYVVPWKWFRRNKII